MSTPMKTCSKCKKPRTLDLYHKETESKDGLNSRCKLCKNSARRTILRRMKARLIRPNQFSIKKLSAEMKERKLPVLSESLIDYPGAPSGRAYIGIAKTPLMPNENGIGYQGVLIQDEDRTLVQCSGCGKWSKKIGSKHIALCTGLTMDDYKERFGLNKSQGLVSDATSLRLTENALKNKMPIAHQVGGRGLFGGGHKRTRQQENVHGTCPEQIKDRLYRFIVDNKELPGRGNRGRDIYKVIYQRKGTFGRKLDEFGLPKLERTGTRYKYTFPDRSVYSYNINQIYDRDALFNMMVEKCPVLKPYLHV